MNKELISNFIRDFCAVGKLRAKSEVRRRLNEILKAQREEIVEKNVYISGFSNGNNMESTDHKVVEKAIKDILKMIKDNE